MQDYYGKLETPCIIVEMSKLRQNLIRMQQMADNSGCDLRPHIKTHKSMELAKLQLSYGAQGITCAKISEAEVMANAGIDDIFVAYPLVGDFRIKRAVALHKKIKRLILAVDCLEAAIELSNAAQSEGLEFEVRIEIDTGLKRTGVLKENVVTCGLAISKLPGLRLTGIYTFKSLVYQGTATTDAEAAGQEEALLLEMAANSLRESGIDIKEISAGSTPTSAVVAATKKANEIRPGTYIFNDYMLVKEGICAIDEIAAHIVATVVSVPAKEYAVIDGGSKALCTDILLNTPPYYYSGYGIIADNEDLVLDRLNEEHGIVRSLKKDTGLKVGQKLKIYPIHICTAVNLQNSIYLQDDNELRKISVDARGMLV